MTAPDTPLGEGQTINVGRVLTYAVDGIEIEFDLTSDQEIHVSEVSTFLREVYSQE